MAHGDKKWIVAYDGKIKRSNDRTKKDFYKELKWWEPNEGRGYRYSRWDTKVKFCPQCKHVQKHIKAEAQQIKEVTDNLRVRYDKQYADATEIWQHYHKNHWRGHTQKRADGTEEWWSDTPYPKVPEPPHFYHWIRKQPEYVESWGYNWRSYLCWKCEHKRDMKDELWNGRQPGQNACYRWVRKQDYQNYRNEVKNILNRAKYDEDYYEEIPVYKKCWLD